MRHTITTEQNAAKSLDHYKYSEYVKAMSFCYESGHNRREVKKDESFEK